MNAKNVILINLLNINFNSIIMAKKNNSRTTEEQKGRIVEYKNFDLKSVKINSHKGLDLVYYNLLEPNQTEEPKSKNLPHPDLIEKLNQARLYYAEKLGLLEGWDFAREKCRKDSEALKLAKEGHQSVLDRITMKSMTISGEGETLGVTFSAYVKYPKKGGSGISSGKFSLHGEGEHVDDLKQIVEEIKEEVYAYRFQNKKAQQDIESQAKEAEENGGLFNGQEDGNKSDK